MREFPTLISEKQIQDKISELGQRITQDYAGKVNEERPLLVLGVLKGSFIFLADLIRKIELPTEINFFTASSYEGTESTGELRIEASSKLKLKDRHVILVEDIVDTGLTMSRVLELFNGQGPASLALCSLLDKPSRRKQAVNIDYLGFEIEDKFVVGYGLDMNEKFRNLKSVKVYES